MRHFPLITALALAILLGCTKENAQQGSASLHEITISADVATTVQATKATMITASNIKNYRIHIDAYTAGKTVNYINSNALVDGGQWVFFKGNFKDYKYYWPDYKLDFFAYMPYQLEKTRVTMGTYGASAPHFSYEGVSPVTVESQADADQNEFVCAFRTDCDYVNDNPVALHFHHPFSLVNFRLEQSIRCTIVSVKITGIKNSGNCTALSASPYASWEANGADTEVLADFSAMPAYSANGGIRFPEDVNNYSHLYGPCLVVPQTFPSDAMLVVEYKALGSSRTTVAKTILNKAVLGTSSEAVTAWLPGHNYSYSLTLNGAANELFVAVKVDDWVVEGETEIDVK